MFEKFSKNFIVLLLIFSIYSYSALPDSLKTSKNDDCFILKNALPLSLIILGSSLSGSSFEKDIQADIRNIAGNDFENRSDDWLLFLPAAELYLAKLAGVRSENNLFDMTKNFCVANLISTGTVWGLKNLIEKQRPDGTENSFPSGHTNIAFTNAAVLYHEYKASNRLVAYSGFVFSAATGILRILNNRHWSSDVITGAGIGILSGNLVYEYQPLKNWHPFGLGKSNDVVIYPQIGINSYGVSVSIHL